MVKKAVNLKTSLEFAAKIINTRRLTTRGEKITESCVIEYLLVLLRWLGNSPGGVLIFYFGLIF